MTNNTPNAVETLTNAANAATEKFPTVFALKIVGYLGHDNKLFDRTCSKCGGMYSSKLVQTCPKCGQALTFITTKNGNAMTISEGTIYPAFWNKQKERDAQAIGNRKNGMTPMYRFKMFSFADANGVLSPPVDHFKMLKGAQVEILAINHSLIPSWYQTKGGDAMVELMIQVYPQYGDTIKVTKAPKVATANTTATTVDGAGNPVVPNTDAAVVEIARLKAKIAEMEGAATAPIPTAAPVAQAAAAAAAVIPPGAEVAPAEALNNTEAPPWDEGTGSELDPFAGA